MVKNLSTAGAQRRARAPAPPGAASQCSRILRIRRAVNSARPRLIALCPCGNMRPRSCSTVNEWYSLRSRGERTGRESPAMSKPWISYVDPATVKDAAMLAEFDRCAREGTPRPESQAIRAHVPAVFWSFANSWRDVFKNGVADHAI